MLYDGKPFNCFTEHLALDQRKYHRTLYPNRGFALAAARKFNGLFRTDKFTVVELTP